MTLHACSCDKSTADDMEDIRQNLMGNCDQFSGYLLHHVLDITPHEQINRGLYVVSHSFVAC